MWRYILRASDPVVPAVVFEDSAALIGLGAAAIGLVLSRLFESSVPDSLASLTIGLLLSVTAFGVGRPFADFLVGRSLPPQQFEKLQAIVKNDRAIEQILSLRAMYSGPEEFIVMAKAGPSADMNIDQLTRAMDDLDHKVRDALPFVANVFIDLTETRSAIAPARNKFQPRDSRLWRSASVFSTEVASEGLAMAPRPAIPRYPLGGAAHPNNPKWRTPPVKVGTRTQRYRAAFKAIQL